MLLRNGLASDVFSIVVLSIVHLVVTCRQGVRAQATTTAECGHDFDWMNNAQGQSPCLVASILQAACGNGTWNVPALPQRASARQHTYPAPNATNANVCTCSAAVYFLMSACSACQDGWWLPFYPWVQTCRDNGFLTLPNSFPSDVAVTGVTTIPKYATTDPRTWSDGEFNVTEAGAIVSDDQVPSFVSFCSGYASTATIQGAPSSTGFGAAPTGSSSDDSMPALISTSKKKINTGVIIGGAVGGLLGIALISVLLIWLLCGKRIRDRRQRRAIKDESGSVTPEKMNILERAFTAPSTPLPPSAPPNPSNGTPPALANNVAPAPVRPHVTREFPSYVSDTSTLIMVGSANASNDNQAEPASRVQKPSVTSQTTVPTVAQAAMPVSDSTGSAGPANHTLLQRLVRSVVWKRHASGDTERKTENGAAMTSIDLLSNSPGGTNGATSGSIRLGGTSRRSRRGTRSGSYSGGGIVLGEQDRHVLQDMSQHEVNRLMANPVPFIVPSRPSSQTYDGMDLANSRNRGSQPTQNNIHQNQSGQANQTNQDGHANGVYHANGGQTGNRGSHGLSAAEEKRRLQKSMGRNVNADLSPPRYTQEPSLPPFSPPGQHGHEFNPLRREPSGGSGSLGATLGSQSQLYLPSEEEARYEHHENLSPSSTNLLGPPNPPVLPYPPSSISPPQSPVSPHSPTSFTRQSSFADPSSMVVRSQDASGATGDISPTMTNMNTNSTRNRPTSALRFTVTNPSHNVEM